MKFFSRRAQRHDANQPVQVYDAKNKMLRVEVISILGGAQTVICDDGIGSDGIANVRRQQAQRDLKARVEIDDGRTVPVFYVREQLRDWDMPGKEGPIRIPALDFPVLGDRERKLIEEYLAARAERYGQAPALDVGVKGVEAPKAKKVAGAHVGA